MILFLWKLERVLLKVLLISYNVHLLVRLSLLNYLVRLSYLIIFVNQKQFLSTFKKEYMG